MCVHTYGESTEMYTARALLHCYPLLLPVQLETQQRIALTVVTAGFEGAQWLLEQLRKAHCRWGIERAVRPGVHDCSHEANTGNSTQH